MQAIIPNTPQCFFCLEDEPDLTTMISCKNPNHPHRIHLNCFNEQPHYKISCPYRCGYDIERDFSLKERCIEQLNSFFSAEKIKTQNMIPFLFTPLFLVSNKPENTELTRIVLITTQLGFLASNNLLHASLVTLSLNIVPSMICKTLNISSPNIPQNILCVGSLFIPLLTNLGRALSRMLHAKQLNNPRPNVYKEAFFVTTFAIPLILQALHLLPHSKNSL